MAQPMEVELRDIDAMARRLADVDQAAGQHLREAMGDGLDELQRNIEPRIPVGVSGSVKKSFGSRIDGTGSKIVGHYGSSSKHAIPRVLEYGRKPSSKMPNPAEFGTWVQKVLGIRDVKEIKSVAFLIARSVARKGTKPRRFMSGGKRVARPKIIDFFEHAVRRIIERVENGH